MGITVEMKNGEKMDGEQFVIGMAASELSYIKEEEALKAWMIVCRTNFVKAASGESNSKKVGSETAAKSISYTNEDVVGIQNSNNVKDVAKHRNHNKISEYQTRKSESRLCFHERIRRE